MLDPLSDPKGYHAALGVAPGADPAAIKAAFRDQAKRAHPDRPGGSVAAFQRVSEAYRVLRDPLQRLVYEAFGEPVPAAAAARPHACCACGAVSAQPRVVAIEQVKSCLVSARRERTVGIFCPACAASALVRASWRTWARGWWSPAGLLLTPWVLLRNLLGGARPRAENFALLLRQCRAFAARGEVELAVALARQARRFAPAEDARRIDELMAARESGPRRLREAWPRFGRAFFVQLAPIACAAGVVAAGATTLDDLRPPALAVRDAAAAEPASVRFDGGLLDRVGRVLRETGEIGLPLGRDGSAE